MRLPRADHVPPDLACHRLRCYDREMVSMGDILALEERAMRGWPALETETVGGWIVRLSGGCTKRANSASVLHPSRSFTDVHDAVRTIYARRGLPAIFRITPLTPASADVTLEQCGYIAFERSIILTAPIDAVGTGPAGVDIEYRPTVAWLDGIAEVTRLVGRTRSLHDEIIKAISLPAAFATVRSQGQTVGFGLAVRERGMIGLFNIVVAPHARGSGYGRLVTAALMQWGRTSGAHAAYLQVRAANHVACNLYESCGFVEAYSYHYRMPPLV